MAAEAAAPPIAPGEVDAAALDCRFFEKEFPDTETLVTVNVKQIAEMGAYVSLLEYGNIEGMILLSELSRRRIRSINKLIRVGKNEVVMVLRVDKEKGYIDLSKRRVSQEDIAEAEERYNKSKMTHSVLRHVAEQQQAKGNTVITLRWLYENIAWPLYKRYPHVYDAFRAAIAEPEVVFEGLPVLAPDVMEGLLAQIKRKLTPQPIKIRCDIEVTCYNYEGIEAVRAALQAGMALSTDEIPVQVRLIAPPLYVMTTSTLNKAGGVDLLTKATEVIQAKIEEFGGNVSVKMAPKIVSQRDETELSEIMKQMEKEAREVDGDEPEE
jgi:translation initiation factor 2 subunit 1